MRVIDPLPTYFRCPGRRTHSDQPPSWTIPLPPRQLGSQVLRLRPPTPTSGWALHPPDEEGGLPSTQPPYNPCTQPPYLLHPAHTL